MRGGKGTFSHIVYVSEAHKMKDRSTEEKRHHSNARVPYTCYKGIIPDWFPSVPLHWHREFELAYIYEGKGFFRIEEQIIPVEKGDIVIIKPGALHSTEKADCKKFDYDTIVFDDSFLFGNHAERCFTDLLSIFEREDSFINLPINENNPYYDEIRENVLDLFDAARLFSGSGDLKVKISLLEIFRLIIESGIVETGYKSEISSDSIKPAVDYIRENYSDHITVDMLADKCHLSKSYFMNLFKKVTGNTVIGYLMQVRVDNACKLLANENMSASEAALSVGYTNISNFNRQFKQLTGCTPKEYKKRK